MKQLTYSFLLLIVYLTPANALWEMKRNPDRFISVGVNLGVAKQWGNYENRQSISTSRTDSNTGTYEQDQSLVGFDVRIPANSFTTVSLAVNTLTYSESFVGDNVLSNITTNTQFVSSTGYSAHLGVRLYFNK